MQVYYEQIIEQLQRKKRVRLFNVDPAEKRLLINGVRIFPGGAGNEPSNRETYVYLCEYYQLILTHPQIQLPPLICSAADSTVVDQVLLENRTLAIVYDTTIEELFSFVSEILYECGCKSSEFTDATRSFLKCSSVDELLSAGYEYFHNPLMLGDWTQKIIAHTPVEAFPSSLYRAMLQDGYIPRGNKCGIIEESMSWRPTPSEIGTFPLTFFRKELLVGSEQVGTLCIPVFSGHFTAREEYFADLLGNLLAVYIHKGNLLSIPKRDTIIEQLLRSLLDGIKHMSEMPRDIIGGFKKIFYVLVIKPYDVKDIKQPLYPMAQILAAALPTAYGIVFKDSIIILVNEDKEIKNLTEYLQPLLPIMSENNMVMGVSNLFFTLDQLYASAYKAQISAHIGMALHPDERIFLFSDYYIYYLLDIGMKNESTSCFCMPEFMRLAVYCEKNNSELLETLRMYLKCGRNKAQTAREMYRHVATIKYRITQIEEITGLDLDNDDNALKLMLFFKVLEYEKATMKVKPIFLGSPFGD